MTRIKDNIINDSYVIFNVVIMVGEKYTSLSMLRVLFDQNSLPLYCIKVDTTVGINYVAITFFQIFVFAIVLAMNVNTSLLSWSFFKCCTT